VLGAGLGEAVFVPRAHDAGESDCLFIADVDSTETGTSALHILNAEDIDGEEQAGIELPKRVPAGFNGNWVPEPA